MQLRLNGNARDAHAQLVLQLCEALSAFIAATADENRTLEEAAQPANDDHTPQLTAVEQHDLISLQGILLEYGLTQQQVMKLRKGRGFPEPTGPTRPLVFRRDDVEQWVRSQLNPSNLEILARRRRISRRHK